METPPTILLVRRAGGDLPTGIVHLVTTSLAGNSRHYLMRRCAGRRWLAERWRGGVFVPDELLPLASAA
jgi:hypothetical protein